MLSTSGMAASSASMPPARPALAVVKPSLRPLPALSPRSLPTKPLTADQLIALQPKSSRVIKRSGDIVFALMVLGLGSPIYLLLGLLVKLSSRGPVFYVQQRVGRDYGSFGCIKFRTMRRDADRVLSALLAASPDLEEEFRNDFKLKDDPRITRLGKFLRRSSLDELPQFVNVLRGEMSVEGPRPIVRQELPRYGERMEEVLAVRPGLTGLWQVSGRNNLSYDERVELDVRYARERSFAMDLRIILRTIGVILDPRDRGAY
jgi:lipopolysaccharide/colanic/teichoic acid biosynthesis glycosyltransferase